MTSIARGGFCALLLLVANSPSFADQLVATHADGRVITQLAVPRGAGWCVLWRHSVKGFEVSDCYENQDGRMVLMQSHLPDFAAGLGHIPGRGQQVSDGRGGYFIRDINEPVPGNSYILRPGLLPVDHRLQVGNTVVSLSAVAPRERVRIALKRDAN